MQAVEGIPVLRGRFSGHMFSSIVRAASLGALAAVSLFGLFGPSTPSLAQQPPAAPTPAPPANRAVASPGNAQWASTAEDARTKAAAEHKLVYFEFESPHCDDCRRMQALLYPAFDFEALLTGTVPVKLAMDSDEGKAVGARYSVTQAPAVVIASPEGRLVFRMQGFKDADDFYRHARKDVAGYREFARKIDGQHVATLSAEEAYTTGRQLFARLDYAEARPRFKRASVAPDAKPALRDSALEGLAATELQLEQAAAARATIDKLIAVTKDPEVKERAELFRAQIPLAQGKPDEALSLYKRFERDHPKSKYLEQVRSFIARLEPGETKK